MLRAMIVQQYPDDPPKFDSPGNSLGMPLQANRRVVAIVEDLMFLVKIQDATKRAGLQTLFVKTEADALAAIEETPLLVILDVNLASVDPVALIRKLKEQKPKLQVIGFISHVQAELKQQAQQAGCDMVMARSAFSQNMPQILKRHAGNL
jgi:CheY-like chemotaxis protein